jgi:hypothetical protein
VINKKQHSVFNGKIEITPAGNGGSGKTGKSAAYTHAEVFAFDASAAAVRPLPPTVIANNQIAYRLPPLSATLFVCRP